MAEPNGASLDLPVSRAIDRDVARRSVQEPPFPGGFGSPISDTSLFFVANYADEIEPWGRAPKVRDRQLRDFIPMEPLFASALGIVAARNSAFAWKLEGEDAMVDSYHDVLSDANFGKGWPDLISRTTLDLSTQDSGAFWEIIRAGNSADAEVIGIANLDASRCWATGQPEEPVIYLDIRGQYHILKWFQVVHFLEMPAPHEGLPGLQYCTLTRMFRAAAILRDVSVYLREKIGGRNTRSIALIKGVTAEAVTEAANRHRLQHDDANLYRFSMPILVSSVDPKADIGFQVLDIAGMPDGFDLDLTQKQYVAQIAMAFLSDYQEFAPLPGGNLGTSAQSEVLHMKMRGKGPALFQKLITQALNFFILPEKLEFSFDEQDIDADQLTANLKKSRAEERKTRLESTEINVSVAQQIAYQDGDLTQEQFDELQKALKEQEKKAEEEAKLQAENPPPPPGQPGNQDSTADEGATPQAQDSTNDEERDEAQKARTPRLRTQAEEDVELAIEQAFDDLWQRARQHVAAATLD